MSQSSDFSKQFFADFIAARIRALGIDKSESPQTARDRDKDPRPAIAHGTEPNRVQGSKNTMSA